MNRLGRAYIVLGVFLFGLYLPASAQRGLTRVLSRGEKLPQQITAAGQRLPGLAQAVVPAPTGGSVLPGQAANALSNTVERAVVNRLIVEPKKSFVSRGPFVRSTFIVRAPAGNTLSGTVFKIQYQGQEEIYGVIASHAIATKRTDVCDVNQTFRAEVYTEAGVALIPAQVVQVGAYGMLDISLVKFLAEDEALFEPLEISPETPALSENIRTQGFVRGRAYYQGKRHVASLSALTLRSFMPDQQTNRLGLCGGAWINEKGQLVGIHTGSSMGWNQDVGYATRAEFLAVLVEAYHNGGNAFYPLKLNGHEIIRLRPDEYISDVTLLDGDGAQISRYVFSHKFSFEDMEDALARFSPRYIELTVRRVRWQGRSGHQFIKEHPQRWLEPGLMTYRYDFEEAKVVSQSKYKVLKDHLLPKREQP